MKDKAPGIFAQAIHDDAGCKEGNQNPPIDGRHVREVAQDLKKEHRHQKPEHELRKPAAHLLIKDMKLDERPAYEDHQEQRSTELQMMKEDGEHAYASEKHPCRNRKFAPKNNLPASEKLPRAGILQRKLGC